jgi:hypothetical protein
MRLDMRLRFREAPVTLLSRNLYDSSHDASHAPVYRTPNYERNHSKANGDQASAEGTIDNPPVIPRINPKLFRKGKELGICH